jgi:hypothetical protein
MYLDHFIFNSLSNELALVSTLGTGVDTDTDGLSFSIVYDDPSLPDDISFVSAVEGVGGFFFTDALVALGALGFGGDISGFLGSFFGMGIPSN